MLSEKWKSDILRWLSGVGFLAGLLALAVLLASETVPRREKLRLEVRINGGAVMPEDAYGYSGPLTLTAVLPEWESRWYPLLQITVGDHAAKLFLDGEPLGDVKAWDGRTLGKALFMLPTDCTGRTITLETTKNEEEPLPFLYLTDIGIMEEMVRADTAGKALLTAVFAMVFLLSFGLFLYGLTEGNHAWPILLLSFAALSQALYFHVRSRDGYILPPHLCGLELSLSRSVLFAAPFFYLLSGMKKRRRLFLPFVAVPALVYFVVAGFQTVVPAFAMAASRVGEVFYLTTAALVVCALLEYRDENRMFRLFLPGLALSVAGIGAAAGLSGLYGGRLFFYMQWIVIQILEHQPDHPLYGWSTLLLLLSFLVSVLLQLWHMAARRGEMEALSARESLAWEQLAVVQEGDDALRRMRHEMVNHYTVLQKLSRAGEWDRLEQYLDSLLEDVEAVPAGTYVAHPVINAVLTTVLARAKKQGIRVDYQVSAPETLPFSDMELCTVLMNLLTNALDANALAPAGAQRWLRVNIFMRGKVHLYICVENSRFGPVAYDEETGLCRTTKADRTAHGYGLRAVQAVARKYQSELLLEFPDGLFSAATVLQMPEE